MPLWPAFNRWSSPGWSFYGVGPREAVPLDAEMKAAHRQRWAAAEWWWGAANAVQKLAEGVSVNIGTLNYAGFWIRVGAKILDGLILGILFLPPIIYFAIKGGAQQQPGRFQVFQLLFQLVYIVANIGYQVFFLGKYGATPGKMACKLRVVTAECGKISYGRATGRVFAEILSGMICYIGYIIVAFDDQKRALHDRICNTRVVYK